ncbi:unnamed protein product [Brassica napus]|uniref:(rape) hypothetical protein n=1 Tax=Brassica napus TaxID=3708 RepID=A0A817BI13_BRANA|nr:unnamed protein product [Brassica napus]
MVSHEENTGIVEWFLGPHPFTYPPYGVELIHEEEEAHYHHHQDQSGEYYREYEEDHRSSSDVDNDEIIARTLQDDFLQLQIAEENNNNDYSNHLQQQHQEEEGGGGYTNNYSSNNNEYGWNDQAVVDYSSEWVGGNENDQEDDSSGNIYSCSSPSDTDEYVYSWESDQCEADGEFGRRLNQMVPIPYVPKINGEIPPEEEAVSDHDRLRNRLELFDFAEVRVPGDGNCQFRALADQLYKTADRHKHVRRQIVKQLKSCPDSYEGYVPMDFSEYLKKMSRSGEWGDHVTLQAAADAMMDGDQDNTLQHGSRQDISPATMNGVSAETTEEISPSQHERWRDLVFDIQLRAQEDAHDDFLRANESFPPYTPSPASKRFNFSPMASPRIGRRVGSMSPSSSRRTTLKNVFNFKGQNNNADIEEGVALKRERTLPIRRTRSVPTLIDKYGNVKPVGVFRVIPTPSRVDTESLELMHERHDGGEDVSEEEAVCRICMVELGQDSEAFKMECMCKGELALAHKDCTIKWFTIKGNITCDVCKQEVKNLPVTLLRVEDDSQDLSSGAEHTESNQGKDVPILVTVSMLAYFCFLEQLLVMDMKSSAVAVALTFACIIGLLGSATSTTMVKGKYVWIFATIQYSIVVLFGHVFYSKFDPVTCIVIATVVGFGLTMSGAAVITMFMEWRRSHAHHQPAITQVATPPFQTIE